jgi:hypothetical protein
VAAGFGCTSRRFGDNSTVAPGPGASCRPVLSCMSAHSPVGTAGLLCCILGTAEDVVGASSSVAPGLGTQVSQLSSVSVCACAPPQASTQQIS